MSYFVTYFKTLMAIYVAIYLIKISKSQKVINFKMYSVRDSDTPKTSQIMNKYYIAKLDQSKQQGEYCVENQECQSGVCYLRKCFPNSMILSHTLLDELWTLTGFKASTNLTLLWRGSRDGFGASVFHSKCDNQGKTLTVVKNTLGNIMGGYTAVPWTSPGSWGYRSDTTAFLFTLVNPSNTPLKLPVLSIFIQYATFHYSGYGPTFGGGHDLYIVDNCNQNSDSYSYIHSYTAPAGLTGYIGGAWMLGSSKFQCKDIEVFRVDE